MTEIDLTIKVILQSRIVLLESTVASRGSGFQSVKVPSQPLTDAERVNHYIMGNINGGVR